MLIFGDILLTRSYAPQAENLDFDGLGAAHQIAQQIGDALTEVHGEGRLAGLDALAQLVNHFGRGQLVSRHAGDEPMSASAGSSRLRLRSSLGAGAGSGVGWRGGAVASTVGSAIAAG